MLKQFEGFNTRTNTSGKVTLNPLMDLCPLKYVESITVGSAMQVALTGDSDAYDGRSESDYDSLDYGAGGGGSHFFARTWQWQGQKPIMYPSKLDLLEGEQVIVPILCGCGGGGGQDQDESTVLAKLV